MKFAIFRRKFNEILPEFHRNVQEMIKYLEILRTSARKNRKMAELFTEFHVSFHFFTPLLSSDSPRREVQRPGPRLGCGPPASASCLLQRLLPAPCSVCLLPPAASASCPLQRLPPASCSVCLQPLAAYASSRYFCIFFLQNILGGAPTSRSRNAM